MNRNDSPLLLQNLSVCRQGGTYSLGNTSPSVVDANAIKNESYAKIYAYNSFADSTLKLAPSMGTLTPQHWNTLNSQTSPHGSMRHFAQWQGDGANRTLQALENAVQRTFDGWYRPNFSRDASRSIDRSSMNCQGPILLMSR